MKLIIIFDFSNTNVYFMNYDTKPKLLFILRNRLTNSVNVLITYT